MSLKTALVCGLAAVFCAAARGQSFNIDLDIGQGDAQGGNGAPSSDFGGAANSPGFWCRVDAAGPSNPLSLQGLDGATTSVQMLATPSGGGTLGFDNPANTGNFALLLNDGGVINNERTYGFTGLRAGRYEVVTYAVCPDPLYDVATVTVPGADNPVENVTGPMPGNQFILGITHAQQYITISNGTLQIEVSGPWPNTFCDGMQIVELPEPATGLGVL